MTMLLEKAFAEAAQLSVAAQDALAQEILQDIDGELRWDDTLSRSSDTVDQLAERAMQEYRAGKTRPLNLDEL